MNVAGIVAEYNPFHNGHQYQLFETKKLCKADYIVAVMSGHFLQRGEPALFNKWARAKMAVCGGVDLVIELPTAFSVRSASNFANGAVTILDALGVVTHLCFGTESGETEHLWPLARLMSDEPEEYRLLLNKYLDKGISYPSAQSKALTAFLGRDLSGKNVSELLSTPNNILGIEYLKSLIKLNSRIKPVTVKRISAGYHDAAIPDNTSSFGIASATGIRNELFSTRQLSEKISYVMPKNTTKIIEREISAGQGPVFIQDTAKILFYLLRNISKEHLEKLCDVSEGLENRLLAKAASANSIETLLSELKTKRYTWTRLQRILSYILLNYSAEMARHFDLSGPLYIRILGMSNNGRKLLKTIKKEARLPVITRTAPVIKDGGLPAEMLSLDIKATDIYTLLYPMHSVPQKGLDMKLMPFILEK